MILFFGLPVLRALVRKEIKDAFSVKINVSCFLLFVLIFAILLIFILIFKMYAKNVFNKCMNYAGNFFEKQIELYEDEMKERSDSEKNIRYIWHDLKNHLICIEGYILKNDNRGAVEYIDDLLTEKSPEQIYKAKSGNIAVDAIINNKVNEACNMGIDIIPDVRIPEDIQVDAATLCVILGNCLDNALDAVQALKENRIIYLKIIYHKGALIIKIKNYYSGKLRRDKDGHLKTSKHDALNHGIGIASVKSAAKKYNGDVKVLTGKNEFIIQIILYEKNIFTGDESI